MPLGSAEMKVSVKNSSTFSKSSLPNASAVPVVDGHPIEEGLDAKP